MCSRLVGCLLHQQQHRHLGMPTHTCAFWECATERQVKAEALKQRWRTGEGGQHAGLERTGSCKQKSAFIYR